MWSYDAKVYMHRLRLSVADRAIHTLYPRYPRGSGEFIGAGAKLCPTVRVPFGFASVTNTIAFLGLAN